MSFTTSNVLIVSYSALSEMVDIAVVQKLTTTNALG